MQKIFWPLLTAAFTIIVLCLWFSNTGKETNIVVENSLLIDQQINLPPETSYEIKGHDIILRGRVASEDEKQQLITSVGSLAGVENVVSELTILPKVDVLSFCISIDDDAVTLTGSLPIDTDNSGTVVDFFASAREGSEVIVNMNRDGIIEQVEKAKPNLPVYDQLILVGNSAPYYNLSVSSAISASSFIKKGKVASLNSKPIVDQDTVDAIKKIGYIPDNSHLIHDNKRYPNWEDWDFEKCRPLEGMKGYIE